MSQNKRLRQAALDAISTVTTALEATQADQITQEQMLRIAHTIPGKSPIEIAGMIGTLAGMSATLLRELADERGVTAEELLQHVALTVQERWQE